MAIGRRRKGFEKAGSIPANSMGFSSRRTQELALYQAWEKVAGKGLARHVVALGVRRGILTVEARERSWYDAVEPLLPQLAARLAVTAPRLGIKKFRLGLAGTEAVSDPQSVPEFVPEDTAVLGGDLKQLEGNADAAPSPPAGSQGTRRTAASAEETEQRPSLSATELRSQLEDVARRYVRRSTQKE